MAYRICAIACNSMPNARCFIGNLTNVQTCQRGPLARYSRVWTKKRMLLKTTLGAGASAARSQYRTFLPRLLLVLTGFQAQPRPRAPGNAPASQAVLGSHTPVC